MPILFQAGSGKWCAKAAGLVLGLLFAQIPVCAQDLAPTQVQAVRSAGLEAHQRYMDEKDNGYNGKYHFANVAKLETAKGGGAAIYFDQFKGPFVKQGPYLFNPENYRDPQKKVLVNPQPSVKPWQWEAKDGPPPVAPGMEVFVKLDKAGEVEYLEYRLDVNLEPYILAVRPRSDKRWEILAVAQGAIMHLLPARTDFGSHEIIWTRRHGLQQCLFYKEYGGPETSDSDKLRKFQGFPVSNRPGAFVKPGREGWTDYKRLKARGIESFYKKEGPEDWRANWVASLVPASQYIEYSLK